jgi:DNA-binding transcriptional LysR family regulator
MVMNITLHQLQLFIRLAETGSVSLAAERMHITQPAASQQLKKLQESFSVALTEQIGKKIHITAFGQRILDLALEVEERVQALERLSRPHQGALSGRLRLAIVSTAEYVMPFFLGDFLKANPGVELSLDVTNKAGVLADLEQNEADLALVSVLPGRPKVESFPLMENALFLVGNRDRSFSRKPYAKDIFSELPLIYREQGSATRLMMEQFFERKRVQTLKKIELTSNEAVKQAVMAGLGFSIMPLVGIRHELQQQQVQLIPVKGLPLKTTWQLIWLPQKQLPPVALAFLTYLEANRAALVNKHFSWMQGYLK